MFLLSSLYLSLSISFPFCHRAQEVDRFEELKSRLEPAGYLVFSLSFVNTVATGRRDDECALLYGIHRSQGEHHPRLRTVPELSGQSDGCAIFYRKDKYFLFF